MLCLTPFLSSISPWYLQGYVTVSEINELYSQRKSAPALTNDSSESEANPSRDEDTPKPQEDEVCVCVWLVMQRPDVVKCLQKCSFLFSFCFLLLNCISVLWHVSFFFSKLFYSSSPANCPSSPSFHLYPRPFSKPTCVHWPENMVSYRDPSPLPDSPPPPLPVKKHRPQSEQVTRIVCKLLLFMYIIIKVTKFKLFSEASY